MDWQEVIDSPYLKDLPFKIELNEHGSIVMTPASNQHALLQGEIAHLLSKLGKTGRVATECSVQTSQGVRVPDVAWLSTEFLGQQGRVTPFSRAPEVCVEITSPSNRQAEMDEKRDLYFAAGTHEVWLRHDDGRMKFLAPTGLLEKSALVPAFPLQID